jgi:hypothetical protein
MGAMPAGRRDTRSTMGSDANAIGDGLLRTVARGMQERQAGSGGRGLASSDYLDGSDSGSDATVLLEGSGGFWLTQIQVLFQGHADGDEVTFQVGNSGGTPNGLSGVKSYEAKGTSPIEDHILALTYGPSPFGSASTPNGTVEIYVSAKSLPF